VPVARPAIAGGVLLALMETLADYGTVAYFGVQTFATGIYVSWFSCSTGVRRRSLRCVCWPLALVLATLERRQRRFQRHHDAGRRFERMEPVIAARARPQAVRRSAAAGLLRFSPANGLLLNLASGAEQDFCSPRATWGSCRTPDAGQYRRGGDGGRGHRAGLQRAAAARRAARLRMRIAGLGYAVPGGVIAIGILVPFAAFDNALDAVMEANFGIDTGLLITGSIWLMIAAYMVRFMAVALNGL
jgi:iron(III) transport system permease protein